MKFEKYENMKIILCTTRYIYQSVYIFACLSVSNISNLYIIGLETYY